MQPVVDPILGKVRAADFTKTEKEQLMQTIQSLQEQINALTPNIGDELFIYGYLANGVAQTPSSLGGNYAIYQDNKHVIYNDFLHRVVYELSPGEIIVNLNSNHDSGAIKIAVPSNESPYYVDASSNSDNHPDSSKIYIVRTWNEPTNEEVLKICGYVGVWLVHDNVVWERVYTDTNTHVLASAGLDALDSWSQPGTYKLYNFKIVSGQIIREEYTLKVIDNNGEITQILIRQNDYTQRTQSDSSWSDWGSVTNPDYDITEQQVLDLLNAE